MSADQAPAARAAEPQGPVPDDGVPLTAAQRDRRTVRRALRAGAVTALVLSVLTAVGNALFGGDGYAAAVWITSAMVIGALVSAGWLVLAMILDLAAGVVPTRRRVLWTAAVFATAFIAPVLPAAVLTAAAQR